MDYQKFFAEVAEWINQVNQMAMLFQWPEEVYSEGGNSKCRKSIMGFIAKGQTMKPSERSEQIEWLIVWTGWSEKLFDYKSDKEIIKLFERYKNIV